MTHPLRHRRIRRFLSGFAHAVSAGPAWPDDLLTPHWREAVANPLASASRSSIFWPAGADMGGGFTSRFRSRRQAPVSKDECHVPLV